MPGLNGWTNGWIYKWQNGQRTFFGNESMPTLALEKESRKKSWKKQNNIFIINNKTKLTNWTLVKIIIIVFTQHTWGTGLKVLHTLTFTPHNNPVRYVVSWHASPFTKEETEAQRGEAICRRPPSLHTASLNTSPGCLSWSLHYSHHIVQPLRGKSAKPRGHIKKHIWEKSWRKWQGQQRRKAVFVPGVEDLNLRLHAGCFL